MKILNKFYGFVKFISKHQMRINSMIFCIVAIDYFNTEKFWYFIVPAIFFSGISDILDELRKQNNNKENTDGKS